MRGDELRSDCRWDGPYFFVYAAQFLRLCSEVIGLSSPPIKPGGTSFNTQNPIPHKSQKDERGFLKQAGQKSSKEELPKQRKGPKRAVEYRLKVTTHIWELDVVRSSLPPLGPNNDNLNYIVQVGNVTGFIISIEMLVKTYKGREGPVLVCFISHAIITFNISLQDHFIGRIVKPE